MKNYVQPGTSITLAAPYDVASGDGLLVGSIFGVAAGDAAAGTDVVAWLCGVFALKKATGQAWSPGDKIYWDNTSKTCTTTASGNTLIGAATAAAASAATVGRVRLNGTVS